MTPAKLYCFTFAKVIINTEDVLANKQSGQLRKKILSLTGDESAFVETAFEVFYYQYHTNKLYGEFCDYLKAEPRKINTPGDIPFLPIEFFKTHRIISGKSKPETVFKSSGTSGPERSRHYVTDTELYIKVFVSGFKKFFDSPQNYVILALLPSYLRQGDSSLVFMVNELIALSGKKASGFYLDDFEALQQNIKNSISKGQKVILFGVSYALLDFAEQHGGNYGESLMVIETGGMKGRRKEMVREELHNILINKLSVKKIFSEYGMTELMSQAYSTGGGIFNCSDTMRIMIRDTNDPLSLVGTSKTGGINIIDLANINSCSFIATQDLGKAFPDGSFEVVGRFDNSDVRGCNLLIQ